MRKGKRGEKLHVGYKLQTTLEGTDYRLQYKVQTTNCKPVGDVSALSHAFDVSVGVSGGSREGGELADVAQNGTPVLRRVFAALRVASQADR